MATMIREIHLPTGIRCDIFVNDGAGPFDVTYDASYEHVQSTVRQMLFEQRKWTTKTTVKDGCKIVAIIWK